MDEDEEVLVEGGVFFSYLRDSGYALPSFETIQPVKKKNIMVEENKFSCKQEKVPFWVESHLLAIMRSGLLFDDHSSFVEAFQPAQVSSEISVRRTCVLTTVSWAAVFGCAIILPKNSSQSAISSLALSCVSLPVALYYSDLLRKQREKIRSLQYLLHAVSKLEKLFAQLKKCILIVQEAEAILSKFKLPGIELVEFRKTLRHHLKEVVYYLSNLTEKLMKDFPLDGKVDATAYCMSKDEIRSTLLEDDDEDAVSVGTLKRIFNIYLLVQSEFLRRLALCYCPDMWLPQTQKQLPRLSSYYTSLTQWSSEVSGKLEKTVKVYEAFGGTYERKPKIKGAAVVPGVRSDIYIAMRSSSLHMQSVLARSRDLEESLETNCPEDESIVFLESLLIALKDMQRDLRTSQDFLDDALVHVLKTKNSLAGIPPEEGMVALEGNEDRTPNKSEVSVVKEIELNPPVEDEVFEAVIKRAVIEDAKRVEEEELSVQEEREMKEREKQKSLKVLSELKFVLKDKATEWKERERLARQRKGCPLDDEAETEETSLDWLPTADKGDWPLPRLKDRILGRKKIVRRLSSVSSKSGQSDEEEEEQEKEREPFLPGTAFDTMILAEAMKKSLVVASNRTEDCFGDSGEELSDIETSDFEQKA